MSQGSPEGDPVPADEGPGRNASTAGAHEPTAGSSRNGKKGTSTGAKVFFACLGVTVLGILGLVVALTVGGLALKRGVESAIGTVDEHREAGEMLRTVQEEHPFEPPDDEVVGEARLQRFLGATRVAWEEMEPWAEDLEAIRDAALSENSVGSLRDLASGARAMGGVARSRVAIAEALDAHEMSLGEYVWTGLQLQRANQAREGDRSMESVPSANLELAGRYAEELPTFDAADGEELGSGVVLAVATLWGMTDLSTWQAMGLDTLADR